MEHIKYKFAKISRYIPETFLKKELRNFVKWIKSNKHKGRLKELDKMILEIKEKNNYLYIKLNSGLKYCASKDLFPIESSIRLNKFNKINKHFYEKYNDFFLTLIEHFVKVTYPHGKIVNKPTGSIVDCGAHIGVFTVLAAKKLSNRGKVIAIEIDKTNLKALRKNIKLNNLKNVLVINKGVSSSKGKVNFYFSKTRASMHSLVQSRSKDFIPKKIEVNTLDKILSENRITGVQTIKIDIEGAETDALKGMENTLLNNNVQILLGTHVIGGNHTLKDCIKVLNKYHYDIKGTKYPEIHFAQKRQNPNKQL